MLTVSLILLVFAVIGIIVAIVAGLIAISPVLLVVLALPVIDYLIIRMIFKKRKK